MSSFACHDDHTWQEPGLPSFETTDALADALQDAGLTASADQIALAARPVILFRRHQVPDASLPLGASKLGGIPTLPAGFAWPHREAYTDAPRLAEACLAVGAQLAQSRTELRAERLSRPLQPGERMIEAAEVDALIAEYDIIADTLARPFPLAFVAQLDLAALSGQTGFDPLLPRSGLLSIFCDATPYGSGEVMVAWNDHPGVPREPPQDLLTYNAAHSPPGIKWRDCVQAEALLPFSAVDLPDCWPDVPAIEAWLATVESCSPPAIPADGEQLVLGDRLCGYARSLSAPLDRSPGGGNPVRHLFTWGAEYLHGTRLIPIDELYDGQAVVMIREQDLAQGRLQEARTNVQFT